MQTYFSSTSTPRATGALAFLTVCSFYKSLLFIRVKIYKPAILAMEWCITISELGPFREGGMGGKTPAAGQESGYL